MIKVLKRAIKSATMYQGTTETRPLRDQLDATRRVGWPYCPSDQGDLLFKLAKASAGQDAIEVGFATGSTAAYILSGLSAGRLTSIDYAQDEYERAGVEFLARVGLSERHELIEMNSILALPELYRSGRRFGLAFLDGWKTFDHIWVDTFFCARMLRCGGYVVFDDARMPAVRKCASLLAKYYGFAVVNTYDMVGGKRQRIWHVLSTRSFHPPYLALRKVNEIEASEAGQSYTFWRNF